MAQTLAEGPKLRGGRINCRAWLYGVLVFVIIFAILALTDLLGATHIRDFFGPRDKPVRIAAVYAGDDGVDQPFVLGAKMAAEKINATGGILGRRLEMDYLSSASINTTPALDVLVAKALDLSGRVARMQDLVAVVDHARSDTAVTSSSIYAARDVLFLATNATASALTNHGFGTVFAMQPSNATNAEAVGNYALQHGMKRFIVLSDKTDYGKESASFFSAMVTNSDADIVYRGFLSGSYRSLDALLMFILDNSLFKRTDFDAIFIVSSSSVETGNFITKARSLGINVPILGMENIFSDTIMKMVDKQAMRDVVGVSLYDPDNIGGTANKFIADYKATYGFAPDVDAAMGYDAIMLVRDSAAQSQTLRADQLADTLKLARYKTAFAGVTGPLLFDNNGMITDTRVLIVRHDGEAIHAVADYKIPLNWDTSAEGDVSGSASVISSSPTDGLTLIQGSAGQ